MARKPAGNIKHDHATEMNAAIEGETVREVLREKRLENAEVAKKARNLKSLRDLLTSPIVVKNYPVKEFKELSMEPGDWGVSYFFPVAMLENKNSPTYVDCPMNPRQRALCERKAALMEKLGRRYFIYEESNLISAETLKANLMAQTDTMINDTHVEVL